MKQLLFAGAMTLALSLLLSSTAMARSPVDNFPLEDRAAAALKDIVPSAQTGSGQPEKKCFFFNPPQADTLHWTVPCSPVKSVAPPVKMCKFFDSPGLDVAAWLVPCELKRDRKPG
ncbi:MAG: hypothetical protein JNM76_11745 [Betaproteobacteria bacterium]|nr:hypothetical protein [Betaproteobacteria bacterium]